MEHIIKFTPITKYINLNHTYSLIRFVKQATDFDVSHHHVHQPCQHKTNSEITYFETA